MMQINLNHTVLSYDMSGQGAPLILIGGLTANCREWKRMVPFLTQHFTVLMPENRGAGETISHSLNFTINDMANDIAALIEQLKLPPAFIIGHSMGGAILQALCAKNPSLVKAGVIASSFLTFPKAAQLYIESTAALLAAGVNMELVLQTIVTRLYGNDCLNDDAFMASEFTRMLADPVPQTAAGYLAQVNAIKQFDGRLYSHDIQCPVLIVHGNEDLLTPSVLAEALHQNISHSKLVSIPACGHMIPQEKAALFSQIATDFFSNIDH